MKTSELTGNALDWAVSHAEGLTGILAPVNYCGKWEHGGPIIEREGIEFWTGDSYQDEHGNFTSIKSAKHPASAQHYAGETPLIAAMRCYIASRLGSDVDVPKELA
jgi:hypothetical protein